MEPNTKSKPNLKILIILSIAILVFLGGFFVLNKQKNNTNQQVVAPKTELPKEVLVTLTENGFEPNTVKIKAGGAVRWTNKSSADEATVNSDDHPTHQKYKPLNLGVFKKGSTLMLIFNTPGTYGYHDHFHPSYKGTVVVE
jgi:plastocyanin